MATPNITAVAAAVVGGIAGLASQPDDEAVPRHSKRTIVAVYRKARRQAQMTSTLRLRWRARRVQRLTDWDDHRDLAQLAAMRDELRDRGVEVGPL